MLRVLYILSKDMEKLLFTANRQKTECVQDDMMLG